MSEGAERRYTLRKLREDAGLTREALAVAIGTTYGTITNIESGRNRPRIELAERIYLYFRVPVGSIDWDVGKAGKVAA